YGKWTYRAGINAEVASGLKAELQIAGNNENSSRVNSKIGGENSENDYRNLLRTPYYVPTYIDGRPVKLPGPGGNSVASYHFFELNRLENYMDLEANVLTMNGALEYKVPFVPGLTLRGSYARNTSSSHDARIGSRYTLYGFNLQGENGHIWEGATV